MSIIEILKNLLENQMHSYIIITKIISVPMKRYPYGNNIEIRFKLSDNSYSNNFYSFHCMGDVTTKFSLKFVDSSKSTLLCKGEFPLDAFFAYSVKGNEAISDTPINLLNLFFHSFNMTMEKDIRSDYRYYLHKTIMFETFEN